MTSYRHRRIDQVADNVESDSAGEHCRAICAWRHPASERDAEPPSAGGSATMPGHVAAVVGHPA